MNDFFKKAKERITYIIKGDPDENVTPIRELANLSVLWPNGIVEEYPRHFHITDGKNACICDGSSYHTHLDCQYLEWELERDRQKPLRAVKIAAAENKGIHYCTECLRLDEIVDDENYDEEND